MPVFHPDASTPEGLGFVPNAAGLASWNAAVEQASAIFPGKVMYLPVASSLEIDGRYTNWLPSTGTKSTDLKHWVRVRTSDGVHLCPPGITRYAAPVLQDLTELFHLGAGATRLVAESAHHGARSCPQHEQLRCDLSHRPPSDPRLTTLGTKRSSSSRSFSSELTRRLGAVVDRRKYPWCGRSVRDTMQR